MSRSAPANHTRTDWLQRSAVFAVLALVAAAYHDLARHEFLNFDDNEYVSEHPIVRRGLSWEGLVWAFTRYHHASWHPLTSLSHLLDCSLFGLHAPAHLAVNLLLHVANVWLLFRVLQEGTAAWWASLWVAAAFGLHPLHVESVAWVSERKDVLSTFFALLSSWAYVRYTRRQKLGWYWPALGAFAAALLSKSMVVTLPILWLLFDFWPLGRAPWSLRQPHRRAWQGLVLEKVPFLLAALAVGVITLSTQRAAGAMEPLEASPLGARLANFTVAYVSYIRDLVWPFGLAVFYPRQALSNHLVASCALLLLGITGGACLWARSHPHFAVGWFWYAFSLLPVSGLVQVGDQARADRFTYLPLVGVFLALAFAARQWAGGDGNRRLLCAAAGSTLLVFGWLPRTAQQVQVWRNTETLFRHALAVTTNNHVAHANLGAFLLERGRRQEARQHLEAALRLRPLMPLARLSLGALEAREGNLDAAIRHYRAVLLHDPEHVSANFNMALALRALGERDAALEHVRRALAVDPTHAKASVLWGDLLAERGDLKGAQAAYRQALRYQPRLAAAHNQLAMVLEAAGHQDEALVHYQRVVELAPDDPRAHYNLAAALRDAGHEAQARARFEAALGLAEQRGDEQVARDARAALAQ